MLAQILRLDEVATSWETTNCGKSPAEIERLIWAFFWIGAFQEREQSSFGYIAQSGPDRGRFVQLFREYLIGMGSGVAQLGQMTGSKRVPLEYAEIEEYVLGHPDASNRIVMQPAKLKKWGDRIRRELKKETPSRTIPVPTTQDFKRAARLTSRDYEAAKHDSMIGEIIKNPAIKLTALTRICQRRGIPLPAFHHHHAGADLASATAPAISASKHRHKHGRPAGSGSLTAKDAPLIEEMKRMIAADASLSPTAAAWKIVDKAAGTSGNESKVRRLVGRYKAPKAAS